MISGTVLVVPAVQAYFVMEESYAPIPRVSKPKVTPKPRASIPKATRKPRALKPKAKPTPRLASKPKAVPDCVYLIRDNPLQQIGAGNRGGKVDGYGSGTKLQDAFAMVAPDDWEMVTPERTTRTVKVNWQSGKDWISVLETIGIQHNLYFVVDWQSKKVLATNKRPTAEQAAASLPNVKSSK